MRTAIVALALLLLAAAPAVAEEYYWGEIGIGGVVSVDDWGEWGEIGFDGDDYYVYSYDFGDWVIITIEGDIYVDDVFWGYIDEDLDVYRVSLPFVEDVHNLAKRLPAGNAHLTDQFLRAATSISLDIAEGAGEYSRAEKKRFYRMAKRWASECTAVLDVPQIVHELAPDEIARQKRPMRTGRLDGWDGPGHPHESRKRLFLD